MSGDRDEVGMKTELALLKQKVDSHGTILEKLSDTVSSIGESIHEISLCLQGQGQHKDTLDRIFKLCEKHEEQTEKLVERVDDIEKAQPIYDLCWLVVKCGCGVTLLAVVGAVTALVIHR